MFRRMTSVLIIEDEIDLAELIRDYAVVNGYDVEICGNGQDALSLIRRHSFQLLVVDLMLPGLDGISLCRAVRQFSNIPIIMVTAKVEEVDRLLGLEVGADDYVCKPFSPKELMARCKTVLRRFTVSESPSSSKPAPQLKLSEQSQQIFFNDIALALTRSEFVILSHLMRHAGCVFSRSQLLDLARQDKLDVTDRAIDSHIKNLRKKLHAINPEQQAIHSIYGLGYRYDQYE